MPNIFSRAGTALKHAWSVFNGRDRPAANYADYGPSYSYRPDKKRMRQFSDKTMINAVYNRIALDVVSIDMHHVKLDENGRFRSIVKDGLENVMSLEANTDQNRFAYMHDVVLSMFDEGVVAEVPVECDIDPKYTSGYDATGLSILFYALCYAYRTHSGMDAAACTGAAIQRADRPGRRGHTAKEQDCHS